MTQTRFAIGIVLAAVPALATAQNPKTQPLAHVPEPTVSAITAADLRTRLYIYAADSMEGRETGTRGHVKATNYIAAQLKGLGLVPMGDNGTYFQNVPVIRRALDPGSTISADGVTLRAGTDFVAAGRGRVAAIPVATVIFGGMAGDTTGALPADQTRGKIVLYRQPPNAGRGGFGRGGRGGGFGRGGSSDAAAAITVVDALTPAQTGTAMHPREGAVQLVADGQSERLRPISPSRGSPPSNCSADHSTECGRARPEKQST